MGVASHWLATGLSALLVGVSATTIAEAQAPAPAVRIENAAARVVIIPELRPNITLTVRGGDVRLRRLSVRTTDDGIVVDGGLQNLGRMCHGGRAIRRFFGFAHVLDNRAARVAGLGWVGIDRLPVITARVPLDAHVSVDHATWGEIGASRSLVFVNAGCGDWIAHDVAGAIDVALLGSGDLRARAANSATVKLRGSGDLELGQVTGPVELTSSASGDAHIDQVNGPLNASLSGSGDVRAGRVDGSIKAQINGSGSVKINGGHVPEIGVSITTSGDFVFRGVAGQVSASTTGSGDIRIAHATGPIARNAAGSGDVDIGR